MESSFLISGKHLTQLKAGTAHIWFSSYLSNRLQYCQVDGNLSQQVYLNTTRVNTWSLVIPIVHKRPPKLPN